MIPITTLPEFQTAIAAATPTVVLFGSPTCPYCLREKPLVVAFGRQYPRIVTVFVDVAIAPEIASRRRISTVPTIGVYRGGRQLRRAEGFHDGPEIEKFVEEALR